MRLYARMFCSGVKGLLVCLYICPQTLTIPLTCDLCKAQCSEYVVWVRLWCVYFWSQTLLGTTSLDYCDSASDIVLCSCGRSFVWITKEQTTVTFFFYQDKTRRLSQAAIVPHHHPLYMPFSLPIWKVVNRHYNVPVIWGVHFCSKAIFCSVQLEQARIDI